MVAALGWDWVGRVRNRTCMQVADTASWVPCKSLYRTGPRDVRDFFIGRLAVEDDGLIGRLRPALDLGQREMQNALSILAFLDLRGLLVNSFA